MRGIHIKIPMFIVSKMLANFISSSSFSDPINTYPLKNLIAISAKNKSPVYCTTTVAGQ